MTGALRRIRPVAPEPLRERARLLLAGRIERRQRRSSSVLGAAIVMHAVGPRPGDPDLEVDAAVGADRLGWIAGYLAGRYELVRASELPAAARARRPGDRVPVAMTFDDDLPSHRDHAMPVLARHGAVGTAFLCEAQSPFWWQLLQVAVDERSLRSLPELPDRLVADAVARVPRAIRRLAGAIENLPAPARDRVARALASAVSSQPAVLGVDGAAALVEGGWELGFHTTRHEPLLALDAEALETALERRPDRATGSLPRTLAYPHGKAGAREAQAARRAGYAAAFTGYASVLTEGTDDHLIGRLQPPTSTVGRFALGLARALAAG